ncbi:MAG TPA: flagellar hook-associated protein FlgL [Terriglobales bacterium]|nr:flagellar hook-associated protein FlgL [Terriglobales bacterium]
MRVNPDHHSSMLAALERVGKSEETVLAQLGSGRKIQKPSDDPAGLAALVNVQASSARSEQYLKNISAVRSQMQAADSSLSSVVTAVERALALGVGGANGTLNDSGRQSVATELEGIRDQLLELGNSSSQGMYFFAGTATTVKPFREVAGNVIYSGSEQGNQIVMGEGYSVTMNVPGTQIFGDDSNGIFASIQKLADAVRNNGDVTAALDAVSKARDGVSKARVVYGNSLNRIEGTKNTMKERQLQLFQQETEIAGADLAEVASQLSSAITSRSALLAAIGKADSLSLFDYLT